jgi:hypothetical protein
LTQEMAFSSEMRKLDIEDKIGYIKYKDNQWREIVNRERQLTKRDEWVES